MKRLRLWLGIVKAWASLPYYMLRALPYARRGKKPPPLHPRALPDGCQWIGHTGKRARRRVLRQRWAFIERRLTDPESVAARRLIWARVAREREPGHVAMLLGSMALDVAAETGCPWADAVQAVLRTETAKRSAA